MKNNRQNYTERRAKTPGVYKPLQHDSRPTTPHDHHHPWKPHKSTVIELPEYLLTTGDENKHIDARTLKPQSFTLTASPFSNEPGVQRVQRSNMLEG